MSPNIIDKEGRLLTNEGYQIVGTQKIQTDTLFDYLKYRGIDPKSLAEFLSLGTLEPIDLKQELEATSLIHQSVDGTSVRFIRHRELEVKLPVIPINLDCFYFTGPSAPGGMEFRYSQGDVQDSWKSRGSIDLFYSGPCQSTRVAQEFFHMEEDGIMIVLERNTSVPIIKHQTAVPITVLSVNSSLKLNHKYDSLKDELVKLITSRVCYSYHLVHNYNMRHEFSMQFSKIPDFTAKILDMAEDLLEVSKVMLS